MNNDLIANNIKTNDYNFNIVLGKDDSDSKSINGIFDTLYCGKKLEAKFKIIIFYTIFSKKESECVDLKLLLTYRFKGKTKQNMYIELLNDKITFNSETSTANNATPTNISHVDVLLPPEIQSVYSGSYVLAFSTSFPGIGKYQFELYYKTEEQDDFILSNVIPLNVKEHRKE